MIDSALASVLGLRPTAAPQPAGSRWDLSITGQIANQDAALYQPVNDEHERFKAGLTRKQQQQYADSDYNASAARALQPGADYPPALVESCRVAIAAESAAQLALEAATNAANAWIARHGKPSAQLGDLHTEAVTAHDEAQKAAAAARLDLGRAVEQIDQARAVLASEQQRRAEADRVWEAADLKITRDVADATRALHDYGL